jgi:hypothetical protein
MNTSLLRTVVVAAMIGIFGASLSAHAQEWHQHVDWAAQNTDAGGSVDCPQQYLPLGVGYAIASGGRSAVINDALFSAYRGDIGRAYQLVLLTQCHNPEAQGTLIQAGQTAVVSYLVENYSAVGWDPQDIQQGIQTALTALAAS